MRLSYRKFDLQLKHPFRIAIAARTFTPLVLIEIEKNGWIGRGECSMPPYLGESQDTAFAFYQLVEKSGILQNVNLNSIDIKFIMSAIDALQEGHSAAKAAIDIALHDLKGQIEQKPVWQMLGSEPMVMPVTSFTLGIDTPSVLREKIGGAANFSAIKVKLGSENDYEIIETICSVTDKPIYADANQGWKDVHFAIEMCHWLASKGVVLIEQPLPKSDLEGNAKVTEGSPIPILADESFQRFKDFSKIAGAFHGINIKLMKSTGLCEAKQMVDEARKRKMKIMIGCMSETSCGTMAGAALAPQCDFADLDGPWLTVNNPYETPILRGGKIELSNNFGLGIKQLL
ncbi:MAG: dipeptide epimerase [Saprospiraceae bacterium]|nr:dipeptide epimerase [Saprospiraceae bacterium]